MHILQLPADIVIVIHSHLMDSKDLCACNQTCRAIYNLFILSPQLYHKLSLARAGLVDTLYGVQNNSLRERTRFVADLERRWCPRGLSSRRQLKIPLDNPCTDYQICNGITYGHASDYHPPVILYTSYKYTGSRLILLA
ncbi:hypothetical protein RSAG8_04943, partial [Rhizoctonia solani AG-8 WAC10335]